MNPEISVIIPVYNDAEGIKTTIASLVRQDYPSEQYEIIVVDNNSSDNTPCVIEQFQKEYPELVKLYYEKDIQGPAAARNKGINNANGDIICFMDADMWVEKDYLSRIREFFFRNNNTDYLGYRIEMVERKKNVTSSFHKFVGFPTQKFIFEKHYAVTAALAVRKKIFREVGLFDSRLISGEDREFGNRVYQKGYKFSYSKDIVAYHPASSNLRQILRRYGWYGRGHFQLFFYYPDKYKELNFCLFNPRLYLPPNPLKIKREFPEWTSISQIENIIFYFLLYLNKLSSFSGYFYEKLFAKREL